jgi:hypothetical protein
MDLILTISSHALRFSVVIDEKQVACKLEAEVCISAVAVGQAASAAGTVLVAPPCRFAAVRALLMFALVDSIGTVEPVEARRFARLALVDMPESRCGLDTSGQVRPCEISPAADRFALVKAPGRSAPADSIVASEPAEVDRCALGTPADVCGTSEAAELLGMCVERAAPV